MDGTGRAKKGDRKIPSRVWNRIVRSSEIVHRSLINGGGINAEVLRAKNILLVRNDTGADVPRGGVLALTGILTDPGISSTAKESFFDAPTMVGSTPTAGARDFGITLEAIRADSIGRVALGGVAQLMVDVVHADHKYAIPKASTSAMESSGAGPVSLLWKEYGTGNGKLALGVFGGGGPQMRLGKTTAEWQKGSLATVAVYEAGTPPNESAANPIEQIEGCVNKFATVQSGKFVAVSLAGNGRWYLVAAEC